MGARRTPPAISRLTLSIPLFQKSSSSLVRSAATRNAPAADTSAASCVVWWVFTDGNFIRSQLYIEFIKLMLKMAKELWRCWCMWQNNVGAFILIVGTVDECFTLIQYFSETVPRRKVQCYLEVCKLELKSYNDLFYECVMQVRRHARIYFNLQHTSDKSASCNESKCQ